MREEAAHPDPSPVPGRVHSDAKDRLEGCWKTRWKEYGCGLRGSPVALRRAGRTVACTRRGAAGPMG